MNLRLLVSLTCLCVIDVQGQSTLGMRFYVMVPLNKDHNFTITMFTYNFDLNVVSNYTLESGEVCEIYTEKKTLYLERHKPLVVPMDYSLIPPILKKCGDKRVYYGLFLTARDGEFGVNVMYRGDNHASATYTAHPIGAYGKSYRPFILRNNQYYILYLPRAFSEGTMAWVPRNMTTVHHVGITTSYDHHLYILYTCEDVPDPLSYIAKNVTTNFDAAVYIGNCFTKTEQLTKPNCDTRSDATLEMLLSTDYAAKQYIVFHVGPKSEPSSYVSVVTVNEDLDVTIYIDEKNNVTKTYHVKLWEYVNIPVTYNEYHILNGTVVFQAYLVSASACLKDKGTPSVTTVIPTLLFFNQYIWSIPAVEAQLESLVLILLIKKQESHYKFNFDNENINIPGWKAVQGEQGFSGTVHNLKIDSDVHTLVSIQRLPFGCYMYGRGEDHSFLHFVGFMTAEINPYPWRPCDKSEKMSPGDLKDNDCDGRFDEESSNTSDDDGDGMKGEDIIFAIPEHFIKNHVPAEQPARNIPTAPSTLTPWMDDDLDDTSLHDRTLPLLLLVLLLIPILGSMLYYLLRKKREPLPVAEEEELPANESMVDPPMPASSRSSQKQGSINFPAGLAKSTLLN